MFILKNIFCPQYFFYINIGKKIIILQVKFIKNIYFYCFMLIMYET